MAKLLTMHHHSLISDMTAVQSFRHSKRLKVFFIGRQHDHLHCFSIQHEPNETWLSDAANSSIKNPDCAAAKIEGQEGLTTHRLLPVSCLPRLPGAKNQIESLASVQT